MTKVNDKIRRKVPAKHIGDDKMAVAQDLSDPEAKTIIQRKINKKGKISLRGNKVPAKFWTKESESDQEEITSEELQVNMDGSDKTDILKNENQDGSKTSSLGSDDEEADVQVTEIYGPVSSKLSSHSKSMADYAKNVNPSQDGSNSSAKILSNLKEVFARELKNSKKTEDPRKFFKAPAVIDRWKVLDVADV